MFPKLPNKTYDIIYADPPWDYNNKLQFDKKDNESSAKRKYDTVKLADLKLLNVESITKENCLLFLWTTNPHLEQCLLLGKSWGFEYKTVAFVWNKKIHNPGNYTLSYCELCLVFKKGKIPSDRGSRNEKQLVESKRTKHSEKPQEVRNSIERMFPAAERIELFARNKFDGWDVWGNEV